MRRRRAHTQRILWYALSAVIVLSMLCSMVLLVRPAPGPEQAPTEPPRPTVEVTRQADAPSPTATAPAPAASVPNLGTAADFTFAVCGDSRDGDRIFTQILRQVENDHPAFLVHTGDLVNYGSEAAFRAFAPLIAGLKVPFKPVPGNHDADGELGPYLKYAGAPAAHYSFDCGQAHLAFADSHPGYLSAEEMAWLDADLSSTARPLKIVILHHPPFDPNGGSHVMVQGDDAFMRLMVERGVRYVFAGHIHAFAAGERDGVTYVITGGAGAPIYNDEAHGGYYHYLRARVQGSELSYEVVRVSPAVALAWPLVACAPS